jgi:hypothetical protein
MQYRGYRVSRIQKVIRPAKVRSAHLLVHAMNIPPTPAVESLGERFPFGNGDGQRLATASSGVD